ncbi:MAG TPA: DUF1475 family protein [Opitutus sp.]|nr:DUF1475 family protein [Opitutus sp.]
MILFLRFFFAIVLLSMLATTTWASLQCPLFAVPRDVATHPWFIATLVDAYWGFLTFYLWVAYQQTSWIARFAWLVAILLLGNIAMAAYALGALSRVPLSGKLADVLIAHPAGLETLGLGLAALGVAVVGFAALA